MSGEATSLDFVLTWHSSVIAWPLVSEAALALSKVVVFWNGIVALSCIRVVALSRNVIVSRLKGRIAVLEYSRSDLFVASLRSIGNSIVVFSSSVISVLIFKLIYPVMKDHFMHY